MREPPIVRPQEWGAQPPRGEIRSAGRPTHALFHHTAGHAPQLDRAADESRAELFRYARELQAFHFSEGWIDSGHNFLIGRNGLILVGRHGSYSAVRAGRMVVSAHCPGQNDQPGVEHEHAGAERMTVEQLRSSAWLYAWIIWACGMRSTGTILPHRQFFPTSCPGSLVSQLDDVRRLVVRYLNHGGPV
jgi:hypothetical protein